jgi:tetratricopeptide (TPR) repeat protein
MKMLMLLLVVWLLALPGCATWSPSKPPVDLLADASFGPPSQTIDADAVFALSDAMERYLRVDIAAELRRSGPRDGLIKALYNKGELKLDYDTALTRNAAEAFEARSGNCLSLVIMTAAFAKRLGLPLTYQAVSTDEVWTRSGDLYLANGHVNVTLARRLTDRGSLTDANALVTIDFLPQQALERQRAHVIDEATVLGMYMNNRAAEALAQGRLDDAYGWAREALLRSPDFISAYNTLGVIYGRRGLLPQAQAVFDRVLARQPDNTVVLANLTRLLEQQGRSAEAASYAARLGRLEPAPPFHHYQLGRQAMQRGDHAAARRHLARQIELTPYDPECHFWLAVADYAAGDVAAARQHLTQAVQTSTTRHDHDLYAAKLDLIRAVRNE